MIMMLLGSAITRITESLQLFRGEGPSQFIVKGKSNWFIDYYEGVHHDLESANLSAKKNGGHVIRLHPPKGEKYEQEDDEYYNGKMRNTAQQKWYQ
jgi:hypothetical protein